MTTNIYIGIDLGTSGCRTCAIDDQGDVIANSQQAIINPQLSEQDPYIHWQVVKQVLTQLIAQCRDYTIKTIAVDATSGSILVTDKQGQPLTPILMYNDNRATTESQKIANIAPSESAAHGASSGLAKLLYLQQDNDLPENSLLMHQVDWINFKLGAPLGITDHNNALKSGYDPVEQCWPAWIDDLTNQKALPKVVAPGTVIGRLSDKLCQQFKLDTPPNIIAGTTDSIAALIATGANASGDAVTSLGSTLVVKLISDKSIFVPEQGIYSHRLGDKWLVGGASNTGGAVLKHYFNNAQLRQFSEQISFDNEPLDYYPLLSSGERFPVNNPQLKPRLTPRPTNNADFLYGMLNGMAKIEQQAYQCLEQAGATPLNSIRTVGGGAVNSVWQTIRQGHLSVPFITAVHTEAAYGAALLAKGIDR
ncbi:MAG: FGGY-family carbohydrate kinase [Methylophagaceae bacterium]